MISAVVALCSALAYFLLLNAPVSAAQPRPEQVVGVTE
jgi:hypothetical protein